MQNKKRKQNKTKQNKKSDKSSKHVLQLQNLLH